ncbi:MAG: dUTP diphosphatase [Chitinophagaceae bacterium]|nr:dUTP diphosphatase [Oligoflexus sp.]
MFKLRFAEGCEPAYMTEHSAAADLVAREAALLPPGKVVLVPAGVWIDSVEWAQVPTGFLPELQVRARSGLARKASISLANGIGTIDADYRDEVGVLLINHGEEAFIINQGDRLAQMVLNLVARIPGLPVGGERKGGFGSTLVSTPSSMMDIRESGNI